MRARVTVLCLLIILCAGDARAVSPVDTYNLGPSYLSAALGYHGLGLDAEEGLFSADLTLGYGIVDRFSAYAGVEATASGSLGDPAGAFALGIIGTPLDSDHVDLDLFLEAGASGPDAAAFNLKPGLELNLDLRPDRTCMGLFFVVWETLTARDASEAGEEEAFEFAPRLGLEAAAYLTVAHGHQLFLVFDLLARHQPAADERATELGGITLGYNVMLNDEVELINELHVDIPQEDEVASVGLRVGFAKW
jgi:hypothetical protein